VIERSKDSVRPRQVGIFVLSAGRQFVGYLALRTELGCYALLGYRQRHRRRQCGDRLAQLNSIERRNQGLLRQRLLKGEIEPALGFREPTPAAIVKRGVPLVPHTAGIVTKLRAAGQLKLNVLISAAQPDLER